MEVQKIVYNGEEYNIITKLDDEDMDDTVLVENDLDDKLDLTNVLSSLNGENNDSN